MRAAVAVGVQFEPVDRLAPWRRSPRSSRAPPARARSARAASGAARRQRRQVVLRRRRQLDARPARRDRQADISSASRTRQRSCQPSAGDHITSVPSGCAAQLRHLGGALVGVERAAARCAASTSRSTTVRASADVAVGGGQHRRAPGVLLVARRGARARARPRPRSRPSVSRRAASWLSASLRSDGNRITSRMLGLSVSSMISRSMPMPQPPVGGMPYSSARMKSAS